MPSSQVIIRYIEKYHNKATVVRQIQSNIAETKRKWDIRHTLATIVLGAIFTFTGFTGTDRIFDTVFSEKIEDLPQRSQAQLDQTSEKKVLHQTQTVNSTSPAQANVIIASKPAVANITPILSNDQISPAFKKSAISKKVFDLLFNGAALLLFIVSILNLIYRWKEEHTVHFQGVVKLTTYLNWLEELKVLGVNDDDIHLVREVRARYQAIIEALPPNDEKDYLRAKSSLEKKEVINSQRTRQHASSANWNELKLADGIIKESPLLMAVLANMRIIDNRLWLGGGAIRNHIWDKLTSRTTPHDDFDIVYFDLHNQNPLVDVDLKNQIAAALPSILKISVKNQARMHLINGEPRTMSFEESIAQWPETATAIAVRLDENNNLEFTTPYGVSDLLNMIVRPTPYHEVHRSSYDARKAAKGWNTVWPELTVQ
jgi:hypothetical protein